MGVQFLALVILARTVPFSSPETHRHSRGNAYAAQHQRQGRGEVLAMSRLVQGHEILDWIEVPLAFYRLRRVAKFTRITKVLAQNLGLGQPFARQEFARLLLRNSF